METKKTVALAMFKHVEYDFDAVYEINDYIINDKSKLRISEIVEVDFENIMLSDSDICLAKVACLDQKINESQAEVDKLIEAKKQLLAISYQG